MILTCLNDDKINSFKIVFCMQSSIANKLKLMNKKMDDSFHTIRAENCYPLIQRYLN